MEISTISPDLDMTFYEQEIEKISGRISLLERILKKLLNTSEPEQVTDFVAEAIQASLLQNDITDNGDTEIELTKSKRLRKIRHKKILVASASEKQPTLENSKENRYLFIKNTLNAKGELMTVDDITEAVAKHFNITQTEDSITLKTAMLETLKVMEHGMKTLKGYYVDQMKQFYYGLPEWFDRNEDLKKEFSNKLNLRLLFPTKSDSVQIPLQRSYFKSIY